MQVLITGGTGVIGAEIARLLLGREEVKPVAFDLNPSPQRLGDSAKDVDIIRGDLGTFSDVLNAVKATRPEVIYHLGAMFSLPAEANPPAALRANVLGTFHVLEAAQLFGVRQVLFSSSLGTYGLDLQARVITDTTLQRPELFYGATKLFGEHMGRFYRRKYGLDFRGLRYPAVVGPGVNRVVLLGQTRVVINPARARASPGVKPGIVRGARPNLSLHRTARRRR